MADGFWIDAGEKLLPDVTRLRRAIHCEPELGLHLPKTTAKAKAALEGQPLEIREGPSTSGFVAVLRGPENGRSIILRGDMDALPLQEDTGLDFASLTRGAMHACGHDAHTAMLVGAAHALCANRERLAGSVYFMFQPGEEGHHGARFMLEDGLLDPIPDAAFAIHVSPNLPNGVVASRAGPLLAACDTVTITVKGQGGHASMPHDAVDPIPIACELVGAIQQMVTRQVPAFHPSVVTIARIAAGTTDNVIPETAEILGTIRSFSEDTRRRVHDGLRRLAEHIPAAHKAQGIIDIERGFPVTVCDDRAVALAERTTAALWGQDAWFAMPTPMMGAEDFSYVLQKTPGVMVMLGVSPKGGDWRTCCPLHSNRMVLEEAMMARGVALHCAYAETFLAEGFGG
ncbi:MAG: amidohydrolase [Caulobacteraceae bacterium]|nr:amidohydrolase [Caulobacteraceae bacterium]